MEYEFILCVRESIYISRENFYAFGLESTKLDEEFHLECRPSPSPCHSASPLLVGGSFSSALSVWCEFLYCILSIFLTHFKKKL